MRRMLLGTSVVAALLLAASTALAGGLNLAWNNCASEGGAANLASDCLSNEGGNRLVSSFVPDEDIAGVTNIECVVDVIVGDGLSNIPAWWVFDSFDPGACRGGSLKATAAVNPANTVCRDWAGGLASGGLASYGAFAGNIPPANWPAHRRMLIGFAVSTAQAVDLSATREYFSFNLDIDNARTVGTPSCVGCTTPACIVFNDAKLVSGASAGHLIGSGTTAGSNFATWQGAGPNCQLVPTKQATWGRVKSLYR